MKFPINEFPGLQELEDGIYFKLYCPKCNYKSTEPEGPLIFSIKYQHPDVRSVGEIPEEFKEVRERMKKYLKESRDRY